MIELLIVVSILGILAYVVMADYNSEIKRSRVRVAGESLYSHLQDLQVKVASGDYISGQEIITTDGDIYIEKILRCWGVQFAGEEVNTVYAEYSDGCDYANYVVSDAFNLGEGVSVVSVNDDALWGGYVFFEPPYADIKVFDVNFDEFFAGDELVVSFGSNFYEKSILINPLTGSIELNYEPEE